MKQPNSWISLYDIPTEQRGSLYTWLKHHGLDRLILVDDNDEHSNELGLVNGCLYHSYQIWVSEWDGKLILPRMRIPKLGVIWTLHDCNKYLKDQADDEVSLVKYELVDFMLTPYKYDRVTLPNGNTKTWYQLSKDLEAIYRLFLINPIYFSMFKNVREQCMLVKTLMLAEYYKL